MSAERVGGVEPETVTCYLTWICEGCDACAPLDGSDRDEFPCTHDSPSVNGAWVVKAADHASALRSVEEELRQARKALDRRTKQHAKMMREHGLLGADRDRLAEALRKVSSAHHANMRPSKLHDPENLSIEECPCLTCKAAVAALSPVQGEHHTQPEGESQMDDNNLNHLIGERDAMKWVDGFLTVVPDADRDLMHTWFACAIESGRMTIQGEHEQDGEDAGVVGDSGKVVGVRVEYQAVGIDGEALLPRDESGPIITYRGAKEEAAAMRDAEPSYDEVFIKRRTVTETAWERFAGCGEIAQDEITDTKEGK